MNLLPRLKWKETPGVVFLLGEEWPLNQEGLELGQQLRCNLEQEFSQVVLVLGRSLGEDPEDHHNRHVTGLLPHLARFRSRQRGLGHHHRPHPARSACLRGPRPH